MTVYLVDFENVRSEGLRGVENLSKDDKVVIFYSKNADAITFDVHMLLGKSKAEIETFRILRGGRNSLDFQLSTYLGYLVMENCYKNIVIVSQDKGFLCATSFWEENSEMCNADIRLCKSISSSEMEKSTKEEFDDGLSGKFIEKINVIKPGKLDEKTVNETVKEPAVSKEDTFIAKKPEKNNENKTSEAVTNSVPHKMYTKTNLDTKNMVNRNITGRTTAEKNGRIVRRTAAETNSTPVRRAVKTAVNGKIAEKKETAPKINLNIQNPTSKNKIFAAEVKLNVADDIKEIISGKYDEKVVPVLVETLGMSTGKQHFYRMLVSRLGQEKGHDIYMMIKGQYANLKRK